MGSSTVSAAMPSTIIAFKKKIYVIGGVDSLGIVHTANQEYDPATDSWKLKTPMFTPRDHTGIDVLDSLIYVCSATAQGA